MCATIFYRTTGRRFCQFQRIIFLQMIRARYNQGMKRIFGLFFVLLFAAALLRLRFSDSATVPSPPPPSSISPSIPPRASLLPKELVIADTVQIDGVTYTVLGKEVTPDVSLSLIPNFSQHASGQRLTELHGCTTAINGGFYTEEGRPLGWFISEGSPAGQLIESNLVTGFFWQDTEGKRHISRTAPNEEAVDFVLQTGPYMEVRDRPLQLISDEPARRSVLGIDSDGRLYLVSVIQKENTFSGPLLADLPVLFHTPEVQETVPFRTILNLDGGTASFFYSTTDQKPFMLSELKPIGSLLCVE